MWNELQMMMAGYRLLEDPTRLDQVLDVAGRLASAQNDKLAAIRAEDLPEPLRKAYKDRYIIAWDLESLRACPLGSLGRRLHQHCSAFGINPATFPARPIDTPAAYAMAHVENTHDIWHVVAGFGSDTASLGCRRLPWRSSPTSWARSFWASRTCTPSRTNGRTTDS
jgi:ubiquinone biosynthesis protein Coq4